MSRFPNTARVYRNHIEIELDKETPSSSLACNKVIKKGNANLCYINLPKNSFYGLKSFILKLPRSLRIVMKTNGIHTKIISEGKWLDYFEVGGPLRINLLLEIKLINLGGGTLRLVIPPSNIHQKVLDIQVNFPFQKEIRDGQHLAVIDLPRMGGRKNIEVKVNIALETKGYSFSTYCTGEICKLVKKRPLELDHRDDVGVFNQVVKEMAEHDNVFNVLGILLGFIEGNIRYRRNLERYGAMYALKMGVGACDEISDLSIRALKFAGYEARFVKGLYLEDYDKIEGHAWVEILTNKGWMPFDPTAKILGIGMRWIKITHEDKGTKRLVSTTRGIFLKSIKWRLS